MASHAAEEDVAVAKTEIILPFGIGDTVWFMHNNKAHDGKIKSIQVHLADKGTGIQVYVSTTTGPLRVPELFESKESLLASL